MIMIVKYQKYIKYLISIIGIPKYYQQYNNKHIKKYSILYAHFSKLIFQSKEILLRLILCNILKRNIIKELVKFMFLKKLFFSFLVFAKFINILLLYNYKLSKKFFLLLDYIIKICIVKFFFYFKNVKNFLNNYKNYTISHIFIPIFYGKKWSYFYAFLFNVKHFNAFRSAFVYFDALVSFSSF